MAEQAGRLEVEVVSNLRGFAEKLRIEVDKAAEGIKAKIGVELDHKLLREKLEVAVKEASAGVAAKIDVKFDHKAARDELDKLINEELAKGEVKIPVKLEDRRMAEQVRKETEEAQLEADRKPVKVKTEEKKPSWIQKFRARLAEAKAEGEKGVEVKVRESQSGSGGGLGGFLKNLMGGLSAIKMPALLTQLQPLIGVVDSLGAGATVLAGGLVQAAGAAGAALPTFAAFGSGMATFKLAMGGISNAWSTYTGLLDKLHQGFPLTQEDMVQLNWVLGRLSPSARSVVIQLAGMRGQFLDLRKSVQESFFSQFAGQISPLINSYLPMLRSQLSQTGQVMGQTTSKFISFFQTPAFKSDFSQIMGNNNVLLGNFGTIGLNLVQILTKLTVAAGPLAKHISEVAAGWTGVKAAQVAVATNDGKLQAFFQRAGDRAGQIYRTLRDFALGLTHIASIALHVDDGLGKSGVAGSMEATAKNFNKWTTSGPGIQKITKWFSDMLPITREVGHIVKGIVDGFITVGNANPTGLMGELKNIEKLGGPIKGFLTNISAILGPQVAQTITSILQALSAMSGGKTASFVPIIQSVLGAIQSVADFVTKHPTVAQDLGYVLGAILGFKVLKTASKFTGITGLAKALGKLLGVTSALTKGGGLVGLLKGISGFSGGKGLLGGLLGKLGLGAAAKGVKVYWDTAMPVKLLGSLPSGKGSGLTDWANDTGGKEGEAKKGSLLSRLRSKLGRKGGTSAASTVENLLGDAADVASAAGGKGGKAGRVGGALRRLLGKAKGRLGRVTGSGDAGFVDAVGAIEKIGGGLGKIGKAGKVVGVVEKIGGALGKFGKLGKVASLLGKGGIVGTVLSIGAGWLSGKVKDGKHGARDALGGALSGAATGAGIGSLIGSVIPGVGTAIGGAVGGVAGAIIGAAKAANLPKVLGGLMHDAGHIVSTGFDDAKKGVGRAMSDIGSAASSGFSAVRNFASQHLGPVKAIVGTEFGIAKDIFTGNISDLGKKAGEGFTAVKNFAKDGLEGAKDLGVKAFDGLNKLTGGKLGDLTKAASEGFDKVKNFASAGMNGAKDLAGKALNALGVDTSHGLSGLVSSFAAMPGNIASSLGSMAGQLLDAGRNLLGKLISGITDLASSGINFIGNLGKKLLNPIIDALNSIIPHDFKVHIPGFGPFSGWDLDIPLFPNIPRFARGGRPPLNRASLVGEEGPELFVPDGPGTIIPAGKTNKLLDRLRRSGIGAMAREATAAMGGPQVVFQDGAVTIHNPVPETASTSMEKRLHAVSQFGLFG